MRRLTCALFVLLLARGPLAAGAEDDPRALVERSLKAMGGADVVGQPRSAHVKVKGKIYLGQPGQSLPFTGEVFESGPRSKTFLRIEMAAAGAVLKGTIVENDSKSWHELDGNVTDFDKEDIERQRLSKYVDRVTSLTALLTDRDFTLAPLPGIKVEDRPAAGIKASCKGRPDVSLYFDRQTGLLVKYAYRGFPRRKNPTKKDALHETILGGYRVPDLASADEKILRAAKVDLRDDALLSFVRARTPNGEVLAKVGALIRKLGDDSFKVRERASVDLETMGPVAIPLLKRAMKDEDREVARRARECLQKIGESESKTAMNAAVRLLGLRKPAGTAEVLLDYLPGADPDVAVEVRAALFAVARRDGRPDPVLARALKDDDPQRRQAAAAALGEDGSTYARQPGRRLFTAIPKVPTTQKSWIDGEPSEEVETFDHEFFNAFDDKLFARP